MKPRLLEFIRCPVCRSPLSLQDATVEGGEVLSGRLVCSGCPQTYDVVGGIPKLIDQEQSAERAPTARTAVRFGYLWGRSQAGANRPVYHYEKMATTLNLEQPAGLVLDAGCGDGVDLANHARRTGVEVIGVELSDGGCRTSAARVRSCHTAHVVQADLRRLPFANGVFDRVYSYGVLHHVVSPETAATELARVSGPGAEIAIYLYEDFAERSPVLRASLALVNSSRAVTTRLPPRFLYALCHLASPIIYLLLTVPHRLLRGACVVSSLANSLPFRHGQGPFSLTGDLYDRFSAPIEFRYSRQTAAGLLDGAGLQVVEIAYERGWMVSARKVKVP